MNLGWTEILLIGGILLLLFGPSKLPGLGKSMGEAIRGFKKGLSELDSNLDSHLDSELEANKKPAPQRQQESQPTRVVAPHQDRIEAQTQNYGEKTSVDQAEHKEKNQS
ncbi:MAG: twin-arginine translocase TatA/TatE family subunit [Pseudobdellovibrionaceae bacterium]